MAASQAKFLDVIHKDQIKAKVPVFRTGDTVRVHAKIVEGSKERIQVFEGVVLKRHHGNGPSATFTVRKVSYNIGVERTFLLHSPRIDKIEVVTRGITRRARLFHLRPLRGKATRIKTKLPSANQPEEIQLREEDPSADTTTETASQEVAE